MPIINQIVSGGGSGPTGLYREFELEANGTVIPSTTTTRMDFTGVRIISYPYLFASMYQNNTNVSGTVNMSDLTTVSGERACQYMFYGCTGLTGANLPALTTLSVSYACAYMFSGCTGLTSVSLPALTTVSGYGACNYMFNGCTGLTSANLPALTTITGTSACDRMFQGCTSLATVYIGGTTAIDFGTRTNQFDGMFRNCTQNIDVYAPAASQSAIEGLTGYPNFGGTGTVTWHWRS